ncbi:MAG TPA: DUF5678 domain-containing protein [Elusimicrobiota bacterium]|jgi:hypothetical protein|nr:DUF5678 domain-containing protein [Elusimicrobiota bacterium]HMU95605.1 DUF5678 domain-containing protein [Elusimicrobiota bacterium]HMX95401.1 DUF5678 domain-containing protein [Elusimicrobiota bacterium]HNA59543.1 DUF5678 domain-containing protein [Elusimicrobiota bacterium]HNC75079.1 DUF5678 domain-containing protein [Elusimicrobiota bacterium]
MNKNDRWISKNFGKLVDLYGGRYVAVADERVVAVGARPEAVERKASRRPGLPASVVRVPSLGQGPALDPLRLFRLS